MFDLYIIDHQSFFYAGTAIEEGDFIRLDLNVIPFKGDLLMKLREK